MRRTRFAELNERYGATAAGARLRCDDDFVELRVDLPGLREDVARVIAAYKPRGFASVEVPSPEDVYGADYACLSLTWNPERMGIDQHSATLGDATRTRLQQKYELLDKRDSYYDTYSFWCATGALMMMPSLAGRFRRALVRSRLAVIRGGRPGPARFEFGWHRDESIFENLRVNIPVIAPDGYAIQIKTSGGIPVEGCGLVGTIETHRLEEGFAYSWRTELAHRAFAERVVTEDRVNLVLGFAPWFDRDENDEWTPNDFFGKKHPFDMLRDGDIFQCKTM